VAKIMRLLRRAELVRSTRGKAGGYSLSRPASEVQVLEVVTVLGGRLFDASFCDRHAGLETSCLNDSDCSIRPVLRHLQAAVDNALGQLTLQSLLANEQDVAGIIGPGAVPLPVINRLS
jgi:Rrf2 family protein